MIIKNGVLTIHKIKIKIIVFTFTFIFHLNAQNIDVAPLLNLDEVQPSYDEEIINKDNSLTNDLDDRSGSTENKLEESFAVISMLNKITAEVRVMDIKLKQFYKFEELKIYAIDCYNSEPFEKKETAVYLNIYKEKSMDKIFNGWMIKSLPSISSMEHPIYDIWVNDCKKL
tara:strand:- start:266 stop:778 length:513 start_codon:yes stop_codon:yes gene_type:complete